MDFDDAADDLFDAARDGCIDRMRELLQQYPAAASASDPLGRTPLHEAVKAPRNRIEAVRLLVAAAPQAAKATLSLFRDTPLYLAIQQNDTAVMALLLEACPEAAFVRDDMGFMPIDWVCSTEGVQSGAFQLMLQAVPGTATAINGFGGTALHTAARRGIACAAEALLRAAPAVARQTDASGMLPLHHAAAQRDLSVLHLLLAAAPETVTAMDCIGGMPLHCAAYSGQADAVRALLQAAPAAAHHANILGWLPLHRAAAGGNSPVVPLLLEAAPEAVALADSLGQLPLHAAAYRDSVHSGAAVQLLLKAGPAEAPTATDSRGMTPLHAAAESGCIAALKVLLAAAPETALMGDITGKLPFHYAMDRHEPELDRCLLAATNLSADALLPALAAAGLRMQSLFSDVVARLPLTAAQWQRVPAWCPSLELALPSVLARSELEARWLVQRLPDRSRLRLRTFALCLARWLQQLGVHLPAGVVRHILALFDS